jgi:hypothetical protein
MAPCHECRPFAIDKAKAKLPPHTDEFEVSIFLTETPTRHSLLHKQKHFRDKMQTKLTSNSSKMFGASHNAPLDVDADGYGDRGVSLGADVDVPPGLLREDSDEPVALDDIPEAPSEETGYPSDRPPKRRRRASSDKDDAVDDDGDRLFVGDSEEELSVSSGEDEAGAALPASKRRRHIDLAVGDDDENDDETGRTLLEIGEAGTDDKKKMAMDISYEGFAIYGRVLCLVVRQRDGLTGAKTGALAGGRKPASQRPGGQASMENWITSTQMVPAAEDVVETS